MKEIINSDLEKIPKRVEEEVSEIKCTIDELAKENISKTVNKDTPLKFQHPESMMLKLPLDWTLVNKTNDGTTSVFKNRQGLFVSVEICMLNNEKWTHLIVGRKSGLPTMKEIFFVKNIFIGSNVTAIMNIPPIDIQNKNDVNIWYNHTTEMFKFVASKEKFNDNISD